jgi:hypothetical protein
MTLIEKTAVAGIALTLAGLVVYAGGQVLETVDYVRPHVERGSEWSHRYHTKRWREGLHRDTPPAFRPQAPTRRDR